MKQWPFNCLFVFSPDRETNCLVTGKWAIELSFLSRSAGFTIFTECILDLQWKHLLFSLRILWSLLNYFWFKYNLTPFLLECYALMFACEWNGLWKSQVKISLFQAITTLSILCLYSSFYSKSCGEKRERDMHTNQHVRIDSNMFKIFMHGFTSLCFVLFTGW